MKYPKFGPMPLEYGTNGTNDLPPMTPEQEEAYRILQQRKEEEQERWEQQQNQLEGERMAARAKIFLDAIYQHPFMNFLTELKHGSKYDLYMGMVMPRVIETAAIKTTKEMANVAHELVMYMIVNEKRYTHMSDK